MKRTQKFLAWLLILTMLLSGCGSSVGAEDNSGYPYAALLDELVLTLSEQETLSDWMVFDLAAYGTTVSDEHIASYTETAKEAVSSDYAAATDFAKAEIIFSKLGADKTVLGTDAALKLGEQTAFNTYSDAVWTLIADSLDSVTLSDEQKRTAVAKLSDSINDGGMLTGVWGDYVYEDPDSTGAAVGAISCLVDEADSYGANTLYEKMLSALSSAQLETGSFGSACTDAFVIIGLCSAGIDPDRDARFIKGENSLIDGLMSYSIEGGFSGYDGSLDMEWSTEQGIRALIAYRGFTENNGAYNIYFSDAETGDDKPGNEPDDEPSETPDTGNNNTGSSGGGGLSASTSKPSGSNSSSGTANDTNKDSDDNDSGSEDVESKKITVTFSLLTHEDTWIASETVSVKENTSVRDLIKQVFSEHGIGSSGLSTGYLRSVTYNGETWGEFDAGPMSGWQYYVNGDLPQIGISSYKLSDGDRVSLQYVADYTEKAGSDKEASKSETEEKKEENKEESKKEDTAVSEIVYSDVSESDWFFESVRKAASLNLMNGVSDTSFAPSLSLTRAMFVTVLHRIEGSPKASADNTYSDVSENDWFFNAVLWASENGIVNGTSADSFSPNAAVTREQMATLAYRYAKYKNKASESNSATAFSDSDKVSSYAVSAVAWANESGIMTGSNNLFNPAQSSKRCEAATIFVRLYEHING